MVSPELNNRKKLFIILAAVAASLLLFAFLFVSYFGNLNQKNDYSYIISSVPSPNIYNHSGRYLPLFEDISASVFSVSEYWYPNETKPYETNEYFDSGLGNVISRNRIVKYFEEKHEGKYDVRQENLSINELQRYINPNVRTPLIVLNRSSLDQPDELDWNIAEVLIGIKELEQKLVFHSYWYGNNYEVSFDDFEKLQSGSSAQPGVYKKHSFLVVQPKNLKQKVDEVKLRSISAYPDRLPVMTKLNPYFKDYLIVKGSNFRLANNLTEKYFAKLVDSTDFESQFPAFFKIRAYIYMAQMLAREGKLDEALEYTNKAMAMNKELNKPMGNGWNGFEFHGDKRKEEFVGVTQFPYFFAAEIYMKKGDYEKASENYQKVVDMAPDYEDAVRKLNIAKAIIQNK